MTNAFILCDLVWIVQQRHAVEREGSVNIQNMIKKVHDIMEMVNIVIVYTEMVWGKNIQGICAWVHAYEVLV